MSDSTLRAQCTVQCTVYSVQYGTELQLSWSQISPVPALQGCRRCPARGRAVRRSPRPAGTPRSRRWGCRRARTALSPQSDRSLQAPGHRPAGGCPCTAPSLPGHTPAAHNYTPPHHVSLSPHLLGFLLTHLSRHISAALSRHLLALLLGLLSGHVSEENRIIVRGLTDRQTRSLLNFNTRTHNIKDRLSEEHLTSDSCGGCADSTHH